MVLRVAVTLLVIFHSYVRNLEKCMWQKFFLRNLI